MLIRNAWIMMAVLVASRIALAQAPARAPVTAPASAAPAPVPPAAQPARVALLPLEQTITVDPGASCLDATRLVRRVARWLQRDAIEASIRIAVHGDASNKQRVSFVIARGQDHAERTISDAPEDCDQLHAALGLSIALAIDASGVAALAGREQVPLPTDEQLLAKPEPPQPHYLRFALAVFGHATASMLTATSAAASVRIELGFMPWLDLRLGVFGTQLDHQALRPASVDGSFYIALLAGRFDACGAQSVSDSFRLLACTGFAVGALRTLGHDFARDDQITKPWTAVLGGIEAQAQLLSFLALAASVDLAVPLEGHRFQLIDSSGHGVVGERQLAPPGVLIGAGLISRFF